MGAGGDSPEDGKMAMGAMTGGRLLLAALAGLAFAAAGCTPTPPPAPSATQAEPQKTAAVAFEPVTGLPEDRTALFATELGRSAAEQGLNIVSRDSEEVGFRLKGYVTAKSEGRETVISYVWDIFADDNARVHRIQGQERLPAALPDPWQAVTDDALQAIARNTVLKLQTWLDSGAPVTTADASSDGTAGTTGSSAGIASAGAIAAATSQHIPAPARTGAAPSTVRAFRDSANAPSVYITGISGMETGEAQALAAAMQAQLKGAGLPPAPSPAGADVLLQGEATVGPKTRDGRTVAVIWSVSRKDGTPLGSIRQVREMRGDEIDVDWAGEAQRAAAAAAGGLVDLLGSER